MYSLFWVFIGFCCASSAFGQSMTNLNLSTRWIGAPPTHQTVSSVSQWLQNPMNAQLEIAVTNLYADTNAYLEIDVGSRRLTFYGAGIDSLGNYIPTNYFPVEVDASLRRQYTMNIVCPNSGPNGSPLYKLEDISDPEDLSSVLSTSGPPSAVSAFLWNNFSSQAQEAIINDDPITDPDYLISQTNLTEQLNQIITSGSIYNATRFSGITLGSDTLALLEQSPPVQGQQLVLLNRLLLRDAYSEWGWLPGPSGVDNSGTAQISFFVSPPTQLSLNLYLPQPIYTVQINGPNSSQLLDGSGQIQLQHPAYGSLSTNYATIQVSDYKFGHIGFGDGSDDARPAPGVGKWLTMGPGCTADTNEISLEWGVSLGRTSDGLSAGQLTFNETELSSDSYTPDALFYNVSMTNFYTVVQLGSLFMQTNLYSDVILLCTNVSYTETNETGTSYTNYNDLIRQIYAPQAFVDILTPNTNETVLNFYLPGQVGTNEDANGLYTNITGSPYVSWTLQNPNPGSAAGLNIMESRNGTVTTQSLEEAASAGGVTWTLTQGSGTTTRVETRQVSFLGGSSPTGRTEIDTISYANSSSPAYQCIETYQFYQWGSELVQTSIPNAVSNIVTTYAYYTNTDGSEEGNPFGIGYGQVKLTTYPDGYWEQRMYAVPNVTDDYVVDCEVLHPYFDGANGGTTVPDFSPSDTAAEDITYGNGIYGDGSDDDSENTEEYDHLKPIQGTTSGTEPNGQMTLSFSSTGPIGDENAATVDFYDNWTFSSQMPPGQANHDDNDVSTLIYKKFLYDHGVFDASANVFDLNPTNHLYTWSDVTNEYPDHMETEIDQPMDFWGDDGNFDSGVVGAIPGYTPSADYYEEMDDQSLLTEFDTDSMPLYPGVTRECRRIYHAGNLVQTEDYVYMSAGSTDPSSGISSDPQWACIKKIRYYVDSLGRATNVVLIDPVTSQTRTLYTANYRGNSGYDGELLLSETDDTGQQNSYTYDSLQRIQTVTITGYGNQPNQTMFYTYDANGQTNNVSIVAGALSASDSWAFDLDGRQTNYVDESGIATETSYSPDNLTTTTTSPGNIQIIQQQSLDRFPASTQGNGTVSKFYGHDTSSQSTVYNAASANCGIREQTIFLGHTNSSRWHVNGSDIPGSTNAWEVRPITASSTNTISTTRWYVGNRLQNERYNKSGTIIDIAHNYDASGAECLEDTNLFLGGAYDRITASTRNIISLNGILFDATTNVVYLTGGSDNMTVEGIHLEQLNGFTSNVKGCAIDYDADTNETIVTTYIARSNNTVTVIITEPDTSILSATNVFQNGLLISSSSLSVAAPTLFFYDALGRTNQVQDPNGNSSYFTYDPNTGWQTSSTDPAGHTTYYTYYNTNQANAGKLECQTDPNGNKTYFAYTTQGMLYQTWGDVPYPAEYNYDEYGELTNLVTFRGGTGWSSSSWPSSSGMGDNTYWIYDAASGSLIQKVDAQGNAVSYTYNTNTGDVFTRSWARTVNGLNVTVTNLYDNFDDLMEQDYNDGTPSSYFNNYNQFAQPTEITDASGTYELTYDYAGGLVSSSCVGGLMTGITVSNHFNPFYGRDSVSIRGLSSQLQNNYGYDAYGRLGYVSSGNCSATYSYAPNSDLLQSTTYKNGSSTALTTTRSWQFGFRLGSIANVVNGTTVTSHTYTYDSVNRRTQAQLEDRSAWNYSYNNRNELTGANRNWNDGTVVSGQQYGYAYDNIGNRQSSSFGGDTNGGNLQVIGYSANNLSEYGSVTTPGEKDIMGVAYTINNVIVNGNLADRKWLYFHKQIGIANTNQPVWQNVTNISGIFTNQGGLIFPPNNQTLAYDADGNLSFDGVWTYRWDGENRLASMTMTNVSGIVNSNRLQLAFLYDYIGRRISKIVSDWNGSAFVPISTNYFIYDGWNLLAIINPESSNLESFMWGNDLDGTLTEAGGVGGLLMTSCTGTNYFAAYDGNGNVTALISAADQSVAARYEYSPYGELIRATGLSTQQNPFLFSSKFWDDESGLIYYGGRYYSPTLGKWIQRDPNQEEGGLNLNAFVDNSPIQAFDPDGRAIHFDSGGLHVNIINGPNSGFAYAISFDFETGQVVVGQKGNHPFSESVTIKDWNKRRGNLKKLGNQVLQALQGEYVARMKGESVSREVIALEAWSQASLEIGRQNAVALMGITTLTEMMSDNDQNAASNLALFNQYCQATANGNEMQADSIALDLAIQAQVNYGPDEADAVLEALTD